VVRAADFVVAALHTRTSLLTDRNLSVIMPRLPFWRGSG